MLYEPGSVHTFRSAGVTAWLVAGLISFAASVGCEPEAASGDTGATYTGDSDAGPASAACPPFTGEAPERCVGVGAPVCGCDGTTYDSPCAAALAKVSIRRPGACPSVYSCTYEGAQHAPGSSYPAVDGCNTCTCQRDGRSLCTEAACPERQQCQVAADDCPNGFYCRLPSYDSCEGRGECMPKPAPGETCPSGSNLFCGCDGQTYGSACDAAAAGTSVQHQGFCGGCAYAGMTYEGGATFASSDGCNECTCEGATGKVTCSTKTCPEQRCGVCLGFDQYCDYDETAACGDDGAEGVCRPRLQPHECDDTDKPVCGCDGVTYTNACQAHSWMVAVRSQGPCSMPDGCDFEGKHYLLGERFDAADSCNTCTCYPNGIASCTAIGCGR